MASYQVECERGFWQIIDFMRELVYCGKDFNGIIEVMESNPRKYRFFIKMLQEANQEIGGAFKKQMEEQENG